MRLSFVWAVSPTSHMTVVRRICGRWFHLASGRSYHEEFHPPRVPGKDDITGEPLVRRNDDNPEVLKKRLEQYHSLTAPLVSYYSTFGLHSKVEANQPANSVFANISEIFSRAKSEGYLVFSPNLLTFNISEFSESLSEQSKL